MVKGIQEKGIRQQKCRLKVKVKGNIDKYCDGKAKVL